MPTRSNLELLGDFHTVPVLGSRPMAFATQRNLDFGHDPASRVDAVMENGRAPRHEVRLHPSPDLRVLLADDCVVSQMMTRAVLARWSIGMHSGLSARDAMEQAAATRFDIILMAIDRRDCDAFEIANRIRAYESASGFPRVPIVAYSSSASFLGLEDVPAADLDDVLAKPCHTDSLATCLFRWLPDSFVTADEVKRRIRNQQQRLQPMAT